MSYADYVAGNWKSVDDLTDGRTKQVCQLKSDDHCVYFKTGDKTKHSRQSAANVLPILMEKGLIASAK
ncbi:MAG: hypothetical protein IKD75_15370 [Prevotella sp.]|nr:hypothetical protein [Prevotella sp.]